MKIENQNGPEFSTFGLDAQSFVEEWARVEIRDFFAGARSRWSKW